MRPLRAIGRRAGAWWKSIRAASLRPHPSTLVLLLPVLAVLVLANWPGWRVAYLDPSAQGEFDPGIDSRYEHGWPLTYLRRSTREPRPTVPGGIVEHSPWKLREGVLDFRVSAFVGDLVAGIGVLALAGVLIEARRRRRQSCYQFYLRELLILVTVAAVGLSFWAARRQRYRNECDIYASLYDDKRGPAADWDPNGSCWCLEGPDWLLPVIGEERYCELFSRLWAVEASEKDFAQLPRIRGLLLLRVSPWANPERVRVPQIPTLEAIVLCWNLSDYEVELPALPSLRALNYEVTNVWPEQGRIHGLPDLKSLESLSICDDQFDDQAMAQLDGMKRLHYFALCRTEFPERPGAKITASGIRHLDTSPDLDWLVLQRNVVDDSALPGIGRMKNLSYLNLSYTPITDAGVESLKTLTSLHTLELENTFVTTDGVQRLQAALPNCRIDWSPREPDDKIEK